MSRSKAPVPLDLPQPFVDISTNGGKQARIYLTLRQSILDGLLRTDTRLPSTRMLAERWEVSRGTIETVFDRLQAEGYIARKGGSGSTVSAQIPDRLLAAAPEVARHQWERSTPINVNRTQIDAQVLQPGIPFIARMADPSLFNRQTWSTCLARAVRETDPDVLVAKEVLGLPALRHQIASYLRVARGIACDTQDIIVTSGIRNATDIIARLLLHKGDVAAVEDPGYLWCRQILERTGAKLKYISVDDEGIQVKKLVQCQGVKAVHVTPAHQAPLGISMSASRRLELLDWAATHDTFIIEDDYDSEFNYNGAPLPAIKAIDRVDRVIFCGSFNKTLFHNLRIGYMVVPPTLKDRVTNMLTILGGSVGWVEQMALARYMDSGEYAKHLRISRHTYQTRKDLLLTCLFEEYGQKLHVTGQHAGFHFILWLPDGMNEARFCALAMQSNLILQPLQSFTKQIQLPAGVVIGYTALTNSQIRFAAKQLAATLVACVDKT